jgi:hypothetical protein
LLTTSRRRILCQPLLLIGSLSAGYQGTGTAFVKFRYGIYKIKMAPRRLLKKGKETECSVSLLGINYLKSKTVWFGF